MEVLDEGPGIEAGEEQAVFERFHRGVPGTGSGGDGLGLPIARELVEQWGGAVDGHQPQGGRSSGSDRLVGVCNRVRWSRREGAVERASWLRWTLLALLGLAVAAGISVAASHLVSQRIGLASEPLSAGKELAPPQPERSNGRHRGPDSRDAGPATATTTTTIAPPGTTAPSATPAPPVTTAPVPRAPRRRQHLQTSQQEQLQGGDD